MGLREIRFNHPKLLFYDPLLLLSLDALGLILKGNKLPIPNRDAVQPLKLLIFEKNAFDSILPTKNQNGRGLF